MSDAGVVATCCAAVTGIQVLLTLLGGPFSARRLLLALLLPGLLVPTMIAAWMQPREIDLGAVFVAAASVMCASVWIVARTRDPHRHWTPKHGFSPADPELAARVERIGERLSLRPPRVFIRKGVGVAVPLGGTYDAIDPVVVLADRAVVRLDPIDVDAVIAHEMGHASTFSMWSMVLIGPMCAFVATATTPLLTPPLAAGLGLFLVAALGRLVNRPYELTCDQCSKAAVGGHATAQMLRRLEALERVDLLGDWFHVLSTRPAPAARIAAQTGATEASDRANRLSLWAHGVWLASALLMLIGGLWLPKVGGVMLMNLGAVPLVLRVAGGVALRRRVASLAPSFSWVTAAAAGLCAFVFGTLMANFGGIPLMVFPALAGLVAMAVSWRVLGPRNRIALAIHSGKPADAPKVRLGWLARRDPIARHDQSMAKLLSGDPTGADELEALIRERPRFLIAHNTLAALLATDDPDRALRHALLLADRRRDLAEGPANAARALFELGRFAEAESFAHTAIAREPRLGAAIGAMVAAKRGDLELANERLRIAADADPGGPMLRIAAIEVALQRGDREAARQMIPRAKSAIETTPTSRLMAHLDRLQAAIDG